MNSTASKLAVQRFLYFAIISTSISDIKPLMWVCNIDRGFGVCTAIIVLKYDVKGSRSWPLHIFGRRLERGLETVSQQLGASN